MNAIRDVVIHVATTTRGPFQDVPVETVTIEKVSIVE